MLCFCCLCLLLNSFWFSFLACSIWGEVKNHIFMFNQSFHCPPTEKNSCNSILDGGIILIWSASPCTHSVYQNKHVVFWVDALHPSKQFFIPCHMEDGSFILHHLCVCDRLFPISYLCYGFSLTEHRHWYWGWMVWECRWANFIKYYHIKSVGLNE